MDNKVYIVVEDTGFYTEENDDYINLIDINACTHFIIHSVCATNELAGKTLERIVMSEAKEWETTPEVKEMHLSGSDQTTWGIYLLGSFYYIQEMEVEIAP